MGNKTPYSVRRMVQWSDSDAARIAYTGRYFDFALEAIDGWNREVLGYDWYKLNTHLEMGAPMVRVEMDFTAVLVPGDWVTTTVRVGNLGRSTIHFEVEGVRDDGVSSFAAKLISSMIDPSKTKSIAIPEDFRERINAYRAACAAADGPMVSNPSDNL
ncbi:MAG: hypothetical protein OEU36_06190 [Gammaproteobacteria bacterium]|nr:hypothetical protein [Gammaproteobacteria bacterium]